MAVGATTQDGSLQSAALAFEGLLSAEEDTPPPETLPDSARKAEPDPETDDEESEVEDESPESEEVDEAETADDADEPEDTEEEPPEPRTHRVKVDGEEIEVTEEELHKGYSRTADYTRKTQALAEERKTFQGEQTAVRTERAQYAERLASLEQAIRAVTPAEPDWVTLARENPTEYAAQRAAWDEHKRQLAEIASERETAEQTVQEDHQRAASEYLNAERARFLEAIPAWKDAAVAKREKGEMVAFAKGLGYTDAEISGVADHRVLLLLRKAMLHDRAEKSKPDVKKVIEKVVVTKPGAGHAAKRPPASNFTRAKQRLAQTGSVKDAALAFEQLDD